MASYESVRLMEEAGVAPERMISVAGGETVDLGNGVTVAVYPSQHSCVWSHTQMGGADEVCLGDLGVTWQERQARMQDLARHLASLGPATIEHLRDGLPGQSPRGDGGALVYLFDTPEGSLLFQDTSGHWTGIVGDLRPDVAILAAAGRGNIDGEPIQGTLAQFVARQVELLQPRTVVLSHHDDWLPGFSVDTDIEPIRQALANAAPATRCSSSSATSTAPGPSPTADLTLEVGPPTTVRSAAGAACRARCSAPTWRSRHRSAPSPPAARRSCRRQPGP